MHEYTAVIGNRANMVLEYLSRHWLCAARHHRQLRVPGEIPQLCNAQWIRWGRWRLRALCLAIHIEYRWLDSPSSRYGRDSKGFGAWWFRSRPRLTCRRRRESQYAISWALNLRYTHKNASWSPQQGDCGTASRACKETRRNRLSWLLSGIKMENHQISLKALPTKRFGFEEAWRRGWGYLRLCSRPMVWLAPNSTENLRAWPRRPRLAGSDLSAWSSLSALAWGRDLQGFH